jgi:Uma2 family endonuclease
MSTGTRLVTAEELWAMPDKPRCELVRGEVRTMAPAGFERGAVIVNISTALALYVKPRRLGVVVGAETGFVLQRNPDIVRGADVAFVQASRIPAGGLPVKYWEGAPDLAVEVVSPEDRPKEVEDKFQNYLDAGARMVLVVNPKRRTVTVRRLGAEPVVLLTEDTINGADVVPGFQLPVADVFS